MKGSRFTESEIVAILREREAGVSVAQLARERGIGAATYYHWKSKYAGAGVPAARVVAFLGQMIDLHVRPDAIRCDNGPELISQCFTDWCRDQGIEIRFIQPGKPDQNACIERFNRTYREEVLSAYLFNSLNEVREITAEWLERYNEIRPHGALRSLPPARYREQLHAPETPI